MHVRDKTRMQLISTSVSRWRYIEWMKEHPLAWALPIQAILLFTRLNLLDPWRDEWHTLTAAPQPLSQIRSVAQASDKPPLYFLLVHFWIHIPWSSSLLLKIRALSCLWALLATVIFYRAWLRTEPLRIRRMFLALRVLSPLPAALCAHGTVVQHAAGARATSDLCRC
jgi:hypothetical protein